MVCHGDEHTCNYITIATFTGKADFEITSTTAVTQRKTTKQSKEVTKKIVTTPAPETKSNTQGQYRMANRGLFNAVRNNEPFVIVSQAKFRRRRMSQLLPRRRSRALKVSTACQIVGFVMRGKQSNVL